MDLGIRGDSALVTASSSGLGKASARALAQEDANVVINGRNTDRLEVAVYELNEVGDGTVIGQEGDLTRAEDCDALVERAVDEFGGLDHLVTSCGGPPAGEFLSLSDEDWYDAFDLLVMSVVRTVRSAAPHLRADQGGTVVNILSTTVKEAQTSLVLSNAVRMSVVGLGKTLSRELAPEIRVNSVLPSGHETDRTRELLEGKVERGEYDSYADARDDTADSVPLKRIGQPMDLGNAVAYLSSDRASFVNGVAIPVDGGSTRSNL